MNICIIGYGRFGKLLYKILRGRGRIFIIDKKNIDQRGVKQIKLENLKNMDWVIPAVPISALESVLKKIKKHLKPVVLVMDVCSVKALPVLWMKKYLPKDAEILGTHPMFGPDSFKYGLNGLTMVFCPVRIKHSRCNEVMSMFRNMGLNCVVMAPAAHDKEAAISLSLVHFIGRGLGRMQIRPQGVSTLGFERLLSVNETVTNDSWQLFKDMHKYNPYAGKIRKKYLSALNKLNQGLN